MDIFSGIISLFGGGITGLLGSVTQRIFEYKTRQLDIELQKEKYANELALRKADSEIMAQEWASRTKIAEVEGATQVETEDAKAFNSALTSEPKVYHEGPLSNKQNWLMVVLDFVRGIIRPGLCIYLTVIVTKLYFDTNKLMGANLLPFQAYDLVDKIIQTILYLFTTCVLFYYGTRNKQKS